MTALESRFEDMKDTLDYVATLIDQIDGIQFGRLERHLDQIAGLLKDAIRNADMLDNSIEWERLS